MKLLMILLAVSSGPLIILNLLGGIVSGIWLAILGEWTAIGFGLASAFFAPSLLGLALLPSMILAPPAFHFAQKSNTVGMAFFAALANLYVSFLITVWCCGVLFLFARGATETTLIPLLIWSYGVATGPWLYMASKEKPQDGEWNAAYTATFFAQLAYFVVVLLVMFTTINIVQATLLFGAFMVVGTVFQVSVAALSLKVRSQDGESSKVDEPTLKY